MFKYLFLIAVTTPVLVSSQDTSPNRTQSNFTSCFETSEIKNTGSAFRKSLLTAIEDSLKTNTIENLNSTVFPTLNAFVKAYNETCGNRSLNSNITYFANYIDLLKFSLDDKKYNSFITTGGNICINDTWSDINKCINQTIGHNNKTKDTDNNWKLWRKSVLRFSANSCFKSQALKNCTEKVLTEKNNTHCTKDHVSFVKSLFDHIVETPCTNFTEFNPPEAKTNPNSASSVLFNSAVFIVTCLVMLY